MANPIPKTQNVPTATIERIEILGKPHTPCPLVQPFAHFVPNPTKNPAKINPSKERPLIYSFLHSKNDEEKS